MKTIKDIQEEHKSQPIADRHFNVKKFFIILAIVFGCLGTASFILWGPKPLTVNYFLPNREVKEMVIRPVGTSDTISIYNEKDINKIYNKAKWAFVSPRYVLTSKCMFSSICFIFKDETHVYITEGYYIDQFGNNHWYEDCGGQLKKLVKETYDTYAHEEPCSCN